MADSTCTCELWGRETCRTCKPCSIDGCRDIVKSRGWCNKHYLRWRNTGDPQATTKPVYSTDLDRFFAKVDASGDCWEWQAYAHLGYGRFGYQGKSIQAQRVVWMLLVGPIPEGHEVDHLCRNTLCVNPDHLEPVTPEENRRRARLVEILSSYQLSKTHCPQGHPYAGSNVYLDSVSGARRCRECRTDQFERSDAKKRARRPA